MAHHGKRKKPAVGKHHLYHHRNVDAGVDSWSIKNRDGDVEWKNIALPSEVQELFREISLSYETKFGGPPPPDMTIQEAAELAGVPLPTEDEHKQAAVDALRQAGVPPEFIHAFLETGLLVTEDNKHLIDDKDLEAWDKAVTEFLAAKGRDSES